MATFVLADELDELSYDFRTPGTPDAPHGVIEEPSVPQMEHFRHALKTTFAPLVEVLQNPALTDEQRAAALEAQGITEDDVPRLQSELIAAVADLCSGSPSADAINGLPYRGQMLFVGYIVGVFLDPKLSKPAS